MLVGMCVGCGCRSTKKLCNDCCPDCFGCGLAHNDGVCRGCQGTGKRDSDYNYVSVNAPLSDYPREPYNG